jgi:hypothetical protein
VLVGELRHDESLKIVARLHPHATVSAAGPIKEAPAHPGTGSVSADTEAWSNPVPKRIEIGGQLRPVIVALSDRPRGSDQFEIQRAEILVDASKNEAGTKWPHQQRHFAEVGPPEPPVPTRRGLGVRKAPEDLAPQRDRILRNRTHLHKQATASRGRVNKRVHCLISQRLPPHVPKPSGRKRDHPRHRIALSRYRKLGGPVRVATESPLEEFSRLFRIVRKEPPISRRHGRIIFMQRYGRRFAHSLCSAATTRTVKKKRSGKARLIARSRVGNRSGQSDTDWATSSCAFGWSESALG